MSMTKVLQRLRIAKCGLYRGPSSCGYQTRRRVSNKKNEAGCKICRAQYHDSTAGLVFVHQHVIWKLAVEYTALFRHPEPNDNKEPPNREPYTSISSSQKRQGTNITWYQAGSAMKAEEWQPCLAFFFFCDV